ncbi:hypothetical protein ACGF07_04035 [Kitasatospora sp. NPDC048194]|uniref:hypothetical protein n=1 Tax=Kitasatospora sp. NPDC048194 TaxID=3364045 RepID=UPI003718EB46
MPDHITLVDTKRLAQLTGDRDPQDWPMMNLTSGWNVVGVDEGPTTEHEGRLYVYFGDVATSDNGGHHTIGWNFVLPNKTQGADDTTGQPDWRFCARCNGLFWAPEDSAAGSVCPFGGEHVPAGWNFVLPNNMQGATDTTGQPDWRYCGKCHGLFHAPQEEPGGACPAGDGHRPDGWIFCLPSREQGARDSSGQPDWHLCATCHGLFWQPGGVPNPGICPAVNPRNSDLVAWTDDTRVAEAVLVEHDPQGWNFVLPNTTQGATDTTGQPDWRYCAKCNGLFFAPHESATGSRCPLDGEHVPAGWNFVLPNNVQGATDATGQPDWRYCGNCHGLFWAPHGATDGTVCPGGGEHSPPPGSWIFYLPSREQGAAADSGQPDWHFCSRCHGLLWTGAKTPGTCPRSTAGGFRLHPVMRDPSNFDPMRATDPVGITKSLERPGGPFSHDGRAYAFVNISAPQYSEHLRPGNPTLGTYLVSKADPSKPGPYDTEFLFSPRIGACPTGPGGALQSHQVLGLSFILPHDLGASPISQAGWRHCRTCEVLFFSGEAATTGGACWATRQPHDGVGSAAYAVPIDESGLRTQGAWKRCGNCAAAVFTGYSAAPDLCPAGDGHHRPVGPELHVPFFDTPDAPPDDANHQSGWRFCVRCSGLVYTYREDRFFGAVPQLVNKSVVPGLPPTAAQSGLVILGFGWRADHGGDFRLAWIPLLAGSRPRLQDTMYYTGASPTPWSPDAGQAKNLWFHDEYTSIGLMWLDELQRWLLLLTNASDKDPVPGGDDPRARPIVARLAATPWELATAEDVPVFDPNVDYPSQPKAYGSYMHHPGMDRIHEKDPPPDPSQGWSYGAYPLRRFTTWNPATRELDLCYLLSLSRPYQVQVMRSTLRIEV